MSGLRRSRALVALAAAALGVACGPSDDHEITVTLGGATTRVPLRSAYAEYVELGGLRNELRLTLADYAVSCEHWIPPRPGAHALSVVLVTPPKVPPRPESYGWTGVVPAEGPVKAAYALPKFLTDGSSRLFEPGGAVKLTGVKLESRGSVSGTLGFEFPGSADRPATRIGGTFEAKMCRFSREEP